MSNAHRVPSNNPVNADARASAALCMGQAARAGHWERLGHKDAVEALATFECIAVEKDGRRFPLKVLIGRPYQSGKDPDTWACPVRIDPLHTHLRDIAGGDSFQALCLVSRMAVELLNGFVQGGGKLIDDDGGSVFLESYIPVKRK